MSRAATHHWAVGGSSSGPQCQLGSYTSLWIQLPHLEGDLGLTTYCSKARLLQVCSQPPV